jgi:anaerobic selenocysteine-containing dehydrogenase
MRFVIEPTLPPPESNGEYPFSFMPDPVNLRWHTDMRVEKTPILARELFEDYVEMNSQDFRDLGLREGMAAKFVNRAGETIAKVRPTPALKKGVLFSSHHCLVGPLRVERA